ncbi:MAG: DUF4855 domain-containing protein [Alicyclobacillaceae bacterium]|nr:DUF4855 domain-containing protein [Alicyclobacillaceae bacterium]
MRRLRRALALSACLLAFADALAGAPAPARGDGAAPAWAGHALYPDQAPGTSVSRPASYPFLPPGQRAPHPGLRQLLPHPDGVDLARGRPYAIQASFPDPNWQRDEMSYPNHGQLTDGRLASLDFNDSRWVGMEHQYGREITVDLGRACYIQSVSLDFLQNLGAGIVFPDAVTYWVSQDGRRWARVGAVRSRYDVGDFTVQTQAFELKGVHVNARWVRAVFMNKIWAFADEFAVFGQPVASPGAPSPVGSVPSARPAGYLTANGAGSGGVCNLLLVYTGAKGSLGTWTAAKFRPLLVYDGGSGTAPYALFDGVLFTNYGLPVSFAAWSGWLDNLFHPGIQLSALDEAVGAVQSVLGKAERKEKVVIAIPAVRGAMEMVPATVERRGVADNRTGGRSGGAVDDRRQAVEWFIGQVMARWQRGGYRHLELCGFYWQPESLGVTDPDGAKLVRQTAAIVHRLHKLLYWIPFDGAVGIPEWRDLGFDAVMIQPNVSFLRLPMPVARFQSVARLARYFGTGVEIEAHWWVTSANTRLARFAQGNYFDYFTAATRFGYDGLVLKSYYQSSNTLVFAAQSRNPLYRRVYDHTARFIGGRWTETRFHGRTPL